MCSFLTFFFDGLKFFHPSWECVISYVIQYTLIYFVIYIFIKMCIYSQISSHEDVKFI
jgi:hypothetical protein